MRSEDSNRDKPRAFHFGGTCKANHAAAASRRTEDKFRRRSVEVPGPARASKERDRKEGVIGREAHIGNRLCNLVSSRGLLDLILCFGEMLSSHCEGGVGVHGSACTLCACTAPARKSTGHETDPIWRNLHDAITPLRCLSVQSLLLAFVLRRTKNNDLTCGLRPAKGKTFRMT